MMNSTNNEDHDQLPTVEEIKLDSIAPRRTFARQTMVMLLAVVAAILVLSVVISIALSENQASAKPENDAMAPPQNDAIQPTATETMTVSEPSSEPLSIGPELEKIAVLLKRISSNEDLVRAGSPQNKALEWVAKSDHLSQAYLENDQLEELYQRYIMAVFYFAVGRNDWEDKFNFMSEKPVCDWFGTNNEVSSRIGKRSPYNGCWCPGDDGIVRGLRLPGGSMNGTLPSELQFLSGLEVIDFAYNPGVTGPFPAFAKSLPNLMYLGLQYLRLDSTLPEWLDDMSSLQTLVLSNNQFTGTVPSSLSRMTNLQYLYLDDNNLEGDISLFASLTNLKHMMMEDNLFHGRIDEDWVEKLSNLSILDASNNGLDSTLPSNFWSGLSQLTVLDLHDNSLSGPIPMADSPHPLQFMALSHNHFGGEIPTEMKEFKSLRHLDLAYNRFESFVPGGLGSLIQLEYLFLSGNPMENGVIPMFLMGLTNLVDLSLKDCNLKGTIPMWLGALTDLVLLDLAENDLTGEIPYQIGQIHSLKHLLLQRNELQGPLPSSLDLREGLETLVLDHNNITSQSVCSGPAKPKIFLVDCEVACDCCTWCCEEGDEVCNRNEWLGDIDPIWEYGFQRGSDDYGFFDNP